MMFNITILKLHRYFQTVLVGYGSTSTVQGSICGSHKYGVEGKKSKTIPIPTSYHRMSSQMVVNRRIISLIYCAFCLVLPFAHPSRICII